MKSLALILGIGLGFSGEVFAAKVLDYTIHQEYTSTRALGMGNAFTAVADDHSALFYNPAGLARRDNGQLRMLLRGGMDDKYLPLLDDIEKVSKIEDETEKQAAMAALLQKNYGKHYYFRIPTIGGIWVRPGWGFAFIPADLSVDIAIHQQIGPTLNVNGYLDSTLAYGYAKDYSWFGKSNRFSLGATVKAIHRANISQAILAAELAADSDIFDKKEANEGLTIDADIGTLFTPRVGKNAFFKPTYAFVVRNIADYGFTTNFHMIDKDSNEPPKLQRRLDFGSKFQLPTFWVFDPHFQLDVRDVLHSNWTWKKGVHAGAEMYWKMYNWWKGHWAVGINQGYWTAGLGMRMAIFQLDIASFGEEVGTSSVPKESRRYMAEMSLDF